MSASTIPNESPTQVGVQIVDSALALVRAEVRLLWSHVRRLGSGAATAAALTWVSMTLTQIALFMLVISPLLIVSFSGWVVVAAVVPAIVLTLLAWGLTFWSWRTLVEDRRHGNDRDASA